MCIFVLLVYLDLEREPRGRGGCKNAHYFFFFFFEFPHFVYSLLDHVQLQLYNFALPVSPSGGDVLPLKRRTPIDIYTQREREREKKRYSVGLH